MRRIIPWLAAVCVMFAMLCITPTPALAQRKGVNDKLLEVDTSKSYALPYALVVLGVALGLLIVARPSTRADEPKRRLEEDEEE